MQLASKMSPELREEWSAVIYPFYSLVSHQCLQMTELQWKPARMGAWKSLQVLASLSCRAEQGKDEEWT